MSTPSKLSMSRNRDNFSKPIARKLAERAGYLCSNPGCRRLTIGPVTANPGDSASTGVAAHISAAAPNGPRYDMSQSESERKSIGNGIWLCATCASLIDKNNGIDFPRDHLRKWKTDHEVLMKECREGSRRIMIEFRSFSEDTESARSLMLMISDKSAFYVSLNDESPPLVARSFGDLRDKIVEFRSRMDEESPVQDIAEAIAAACRHYMNVTPSGATLTEIEYSLGAVRKAVGVSLLMLAKMYPIEIPYNLQSLLPVV